MNLGTLTGDLGCFPLDHGPYHSQSDCRGPTYGIRSLIGISIPGWDHHSFSALPPHVCFATLVLKLFRGEPAIAGFDWNFSASHNSSANVSTGVGSVLQVVSPTLQPGRG